ncbi:MAG: UDP-N-acetylmuramate--L-alanine ligase [Clostridiales bacterium]|jgi:UDP-N-acetylmuramate--alanine ligase|nr:UDP-N-acetylmuramate--L-alanine ligase [Clostridiales bacterium]
MRKHAHFIGIGGVSMSGLAEILYNKGWKVTGSDSKPSDITAHLEALGIGVAIGQRADNITAGIDLVVYTAAVKQDNVELAAARARNLKIVDRAELLGNIMKDFSCPVCISGTHGKTSTTSMITEILLAAGMDPSVSVGGFLNAINGNFRMGHSRYFVVESCEYADSFLKFYPSIGVILNVDRDHLDYFTDIEAIEASFRRFAQNIPDDGTLVIFGEVPLRVWEGLKCRVITYGSEGSRVTAEDLKFDSDGFPSFRIMDNGEVIGAVRLRVHGEHNVKNALAACAAARAAGAGSEAVITGLSRFDGVKRRFEEKGAFNGVRVIDDYAHHPTEIKATLAAVSKSDHNRIFCVFQPHTYTRTIALLDEFARCFTDADKIIVLDIYAAREKDTGAINARTLTDHIKAAGSDAFYCPSVETARTYLMEQCVPGDICITVGAGDVYLLGESLVGRQFRAS